MARARAQITIDRSADEVWKRIGDFADLSWFPGVDGCTVKGDERTTKVTGRNLEHIERLLRRDAAARTYTYETSGYRGETVVTFPDGRRFDLNSTVGHHRGTISVVPEDLQHATVLYDVELDDEQMITGMTEGYQSVLNALKREMEEQREETP